VPLNFFGRGNSNALGVSPQAHTVQLKQAKGVKLKTGFTKKKEKKYK